MEKEVATWNITACMGGTRRSERVEVSLPVRVCSTGETGRFQEIARTLNASCDGIFFVSKVQPYRVGMSLVVTFPYSLAGDCRVNFFGRGVRVEPWLDGQLGVAIELIVPCKQGDDFRIGILQSAETAAPLIVTTRALANHYRVSETHVRHELIALAHSGLIRLSAWDGQSERPYHEWPDVDSFFSNTADHGRVRIRNGEQNV